MKQRKNLSRIVCLLLVAMLIVSMVPVMPASAATGTLASYYSTNAAGNGAKKTITVDGSISDWDSSMLIAQGTANDDPRVYRPNSMYEIPIDMYALYGAYDNENLYLMWEMTNVQDVVAPNDDYPLSQGILYQTMNVPFFIAIDTGDTATAIGNDGALIGGGTIWDSGITIGQPFNKLIAISTNGANGPFLYGGTSEGLNAKEEAAGTAAVGMSFNYGLGILSQNVYGIDKAYGEYNNRVVGDMCNEDAAWVDFNTLGHSSSTMDFHYEMSISLASLGVTAADVEANGLGVLVVATMGKSGMDCLPYDLSMNDQADLDDADGSQEFNSFEKSDLDHITTGFAKIGGSSCNHSWGTGSVTTAATCTTDGVKTYTCSLCSATKTETIKSSGHNYVNGTCSTCGAVESCSHSWNSGVVTTAATCTTDGVKTYTCTLCSETKTETIKSSGHNYVNGTCTGCGATNGTVAADGMLYLKPSSNWTNDGARFAAYFFEGDNNNTWVSMTDSDGDGVYEVEAPSGYSNVIFCRMNPGTTANNWDSNVMWNQTEDLVIPTDGTNCYTVNEGTWDKGGGSWSTVGGGCAHSYGTGTVTKAATCTEDGVKTYTCSLCGETKTETITSPGHNYVNGTCTVCGATNGTVAADGMLYLKPSSNWQEADARFAAYFFEGDNNNTWVSMTDSDGDGIYEVEAPSGYSNVIFCRMNGTATENNWDNRWNQTADLVIPTDGKNCFVCTEGTWDDDMGSWTTVGGGCAHSYGTGVVTKEATCTEDGVKTYTCSLCGETKTETITSPGHNYVNGTCTRCGATESTTGKVLYFDNSANNWSSVSIYYWSDANTAMVTWPGVAMTKVDGDIYSYTVPADATRVIFNNGSDAGKTGDLNIPTDGKNLYNGSAWSSYATCSHNWGTGVVTKEATCTADGVKTYTCSLCGETKTETITSPGHNYVNGTCTICGATEPCSHSWGDGVETTAATCTTSGVKTYTCSLCGETKTETISALGHDMVDGTCTRCGETDSCSHFWRQGSTVSATCEKEGYTTYTCLFCKGTKKEVIPAKGHKYSAGRCYVCGVDAESIDYVDIATAADLIAFANRVNAGETTLNARLTADIDLGGATWTSIGTYCPNGDSSASVCYKGRFNGNGHTISNFTVAGTDCVGLIGYAEMAVIQNLGVVNVTATGWQAGAIAGYAPTSTIENCFAKDCKITGYTTNPVAESSRAIHIGAVAGSNGGTVKNCYAINCTLVEKTGDMTVPSDYPDKITTEDGTVIDLPPYYTANVAPVGGSSCSNNFYCNVSGTFTTTSGSTEATAAQMASGEITYKLNNGVTNGTQVWYQTCGQGLPAFSGKTVFENNGSYTNDGVVECAHPSHDQSGKCTNCGETVEHSYTSVVTAPTCAKEGYTTYTCSVCKHSYTGNTVAATGNHNYVDGKCTSCGQAKPVVQPTLTVTNIGLSLKDEVIYNVYFSASDISDVVEMGLLGFNTQNENGTISNADYVTPGYTTSGQYYVAHSNGISAKNLSDDYYYMVYAKLSDGTYAYSPMKSYNAVKYANAILGDASSNAKLKAVVVAMLNYGAAAQVQFEYKTDALMNAGLTAEQKALVKAYDESMVNDVLSVDSTKAGEFATKYASSRSVGISLKGAFAINYYLTASKAVDSGMTLYYWTEADYKAASTLTTANATGSVTMEATGTANQFKAAVEGISAKRIDETIFVVGVYESNGVTYSTGVLAYSLGRYCEQQATSSNAALAAMAQATAAYGYYAQAYFGN